MRIAWSPRAIRQLGHLRAYIARENATAAGEVAERILASVDLLAAHPHIGRPGRISGTRELVIPQTPYIVAYRFGEHLLEISAIFHGRQRWPDTL